MREWGNSVVLKKNNPEGVDEQYVWKSLLNDMYKSVIVNKIRNPDIYLLRSLSENGDVKVAWYIGSEETLMKRVRDEKYEVVGVLKAKTSEHHKENSLLNWAKEKFLGIKKRPQEQNPYH